MNAVAAEQCVKVLIVSGRVYRDQKQERPVMDRPVISSFHRAADEPLGERDTRFNHQCRRHSHEEGPEHGASLRLCGPRPLHGARGTVTGPLRSSTGIEFRKGPELP